MVQLYFNKILDGTITIDNVPKLWKSKVQAKLDEYYASIAEETIEEEPITEPVEEETEDAVEETETESVPEVSEETEAET